MHNPTQTTYPLWEPKPERIKAQNRAAPIQKKFEVSTCSEQALPWTTQTANRHTKLSQAPASAYLSPTDTCVLHPELPCALQVWRHTVHISSSRGTLRRQSHIHWRHWLSNYSGYYGPDKFIRPKRIPHNQSLSTVFRKWYHLDRGCS